MSTPASPVLVEKDQDPQASTVQDVFGTQKAIGRDLAYVRQQIQNFTTQSARLSAVAREVETASLSFGHLEQFLEVIEKEMEDVAQVLRIIHRRASGAPASV